MLERSEIFARHIIDNNTTIRKTASFFNISKSTVHNDVSNKLKKINANLYQQVQKILKINFNEKHLRGGEATRQLYKRLNAKSAKK